MAVIAKEGSNQQQVEEWGRRGKAEVASKEEKLTLVQGQR